MVTESKINTMKVSQFTLSVLSVLSCCYTTTAFVPVSRVSKSTDLTISFTAGGSQSCSKVMATTTSEEIIPREVLFGNPTYAGEFFALFDTDTLLLHLTFCPETFYSHKCSVNCLP